MGLFEKIQSFTQYHELYIKCFCYKTILSKHCVTHTRFIKMAKQFQISLPVSFILHDLYLMLSATEMFYTVQRFFAFLEVTVCKRFLYLWMPVHVGSGIMGK